MTFKLPSTALAFFATWAGMSNAQDVPQIQFEVEPQIVELGGQVDIKEAAPAQISLSLPVDPVAQQQKYCSFMYHMVSTPILHIPYNKRQHALATFHFLWDRSACCSLSCLVLLVVMDLLQLLLKDTPQYIDSTFLC